MLSIPSFLRHLFLKSSYIKYIKRTILKYGLNNIPPLKLSPLTSLFIYCYYTTIYPFAAVNYIRKAIGYEDYIRQYADEKKQDKASLYEILDEISQSTKTCRTFPEWFEYIKAYTEQLQNKKPDNAGGDRGRNSMDSVTVSTMHASKGLEYKKVFLVGLNEGNVPYHKAVLEKELEEERRMFYVAMTRAKEELHLYFPRERAGKAQKISRFLQEIDRSSAVWELIEDK